MDISFLWSIKRNKSNVEQVEKIKEYLGEAAKRIDKGFQSNQKFKDYEDFINHNELALTLDSIQELLEETKMNNSEI